MIIDLEKFIGGESRYWSELEQTLDRMENHPDRKMEISEVRRFHYLYQRTSADLAKIMTFSSERETRRYLESLTARAFAEIHETREKPHKFAPHKWLFVLFPQAFRRRIHAFWLSLVIFTVGGMFGGLFVAMDYESKHILMPFSHLQGDPSDRVRMEETAEADRSEGQKTRFSSFLMTHNTKVSIYAMALGMTWGIGTILILFSNGVILGAVGIDYMMAGETEFLFGWLLPHGSIEIPAILIASQAGLVLAGALIGWGKPVSFGTRLREVSNDLVILIFGAAAMLVWAGIIESFLSQHHEPVIPYSFKIGFGLIELILLIWFLSRAGIHGEPEKA